MENGTRYGLLDARKPSGIDAKCGDHFPQADFPLPIWRDSKKRVCPTIVIPPSDRANLDVVVAHTCGDEAVREAVSVFIDRVGL